jgi:hypothetical protein
VCTLWASLHPSVITLRYQPSSWSCPRLVCARVSWQTRGVLVAYLPCFHAGPCYKLITWLVTRVIYSCCVNSFLCVNCCPSGLGLHHRERQRGREGGREGGREAKMRGAETRVQMSTRHASTQRPLLLSKNTCTARL